jgi:sulfite reductase (ferredoxin)
LVVITDDQDELQGFNVYAGGGLGRTHNKEETFARLADPIGYVDKADVYDLIKAIVATQRDHGDRSNRRHARMKYLLHDWGVDKFRSLVEGYFGKPLQPLKPTPEFKYQDFLGWHEQGDGKLFLGISIENGRIKDEGTFQLKTALREVEQAFALPINVTPSQNLILYDIDPAHQDKIQSILDRCGIKQESDIDPILRYSMACPALPTCGLAITESERALPGFLERIRALLNQVGLEGEHFVIRMTGCPNGCARPYLAEVGFVGQSPDAYQVWLGADPNQTRLAEPYLDNMASQDLEKTLEPLLVYYKQERQQGIEPESFGDFCHRVGFDALRQFAATYESNVMASPTSEPAVITIASEPNVMASLTSEPAVLAGEPAVTTASEPAVIASKASGGGKARHRIGIRDEVYDRLKTVAMSQGMPMTDLVNRAIEAYLKTLE